MEVGEGEIEQVKHQRRKYATKDDQRKRENKGSEEEI